MNCVTEVSEIFGLDLEKCQRVYESAIFTGEGAGKKKKKVAKSRDRDHRDLLLTQIVILQSNQSDAFFFFF